MRPKSRPARQRPALVALPKARAQIHAADTKGVTAELIPPGDAPAYDCRRNAVRSPHETKTGQGNLTLLPDGDCCGESGCC